MPVKSKLESDKLNTFIYNDVLPVQCPRATRGRELETQVMVLRGDDNG